MVALPICKTEMVTLTFLHKAEPREQKMLYQPNSDPTSRDGMTHVNLVGWNQDLGMLNTQR